MIAAAVGGWTVAVACAAAALVMRARLVRVADAEHELRGALTAFGLGVHRLGRTAAGRTVAASLESELLRARTALADLSAAPPGDEPPLALERLTRSAAAAWGPAALGHGVDVDWRAGGGVATAAPGRVAQVLGNLVSNAQRHGDGRVAIRAVPVADAVRIEVTNAVSGQPGLRRRDARGLRIARRASRAAGGRLTVQVRPERVSAALDLPVEP